MDEEYVNDLEDQLRIANEKLKLTENKLDSIKDLVYKTFNGDSAAALELSNIVGVPAPILYCDDEVTSEKPKINEQVSSSKEANKRFSNRLEFLNQVMSDHGKMMLNNQAKPLTSNKIRSASGHHRVRSADRTPTQIDRLYSNPYSWSLNEHTNVNMNSMFRHVIPSASATNLSRSLSNKSAKTRSESRPNNSHDIKVEDFLHHSANRRPLKTHGNSKKNIPDNDFQLMPESETSVSKPPKAKRPTSSSLSNNRKNASKDRPKNKLSTPYHNLNLQSMSESDNKAQELLRAMEKRFELSTIDLQRRLGISQAGMVGP